MSTSLLLPLHLSAACPSSAHLHAADDVPCTQVVRTTLHHQRASAWSLVLMAKGIDGWVLRNDDVLELHVPAAQSAHALAELAAADAEERARALDEARVQHAGIESLPSSHAWLAAVLVGVLLIAFQLVTGPRSTGGAWFAQGASDATRVLQGEGYRTITALTLHGDAAHVLSNVGFGTLAVGAVMRSTGVGVGTFLVVSAGALGNFANALVHGSHHSSVGFSTGVFAAIGLLGALGYAEARRHPARRPRAWTALAASVALLAALGSSEKSDVLAHLFGGLAGTGLGLVVGFTPLRALRAPTQWVAGLAAAGAVLGAWALALA